MYEWDKSFSEFQLEYLMQNDRLFHFTDSQHSLDSGYANLSHKMSLQSPFSSSVLYVGLRLTKHHCCGIFEEENPQRASYINQVKLPQHRTCNFSFDVFLTASVSNVTKVADVQNMFLLFEQRQSSDLPQWEQKNTNGSSQVKDD